MALRRAVHCAAVLWLLQFAAAGAADPADAARGRALYENHCRTCHTEKVHSRPRHPPPDLVELRAIVVRWQRAEQLRWSDQDVADVVEYLNRTRYGKVPG